MPVTTTEGIRISLGDSWNHNFGCAAQYFQMCNGLYNTIDDREQGRSL